jgi:3-hydroxyacyl-CoA dehydrogenase
MSQTKYAIHRVAVLGAGTMGARIAAHIANAGFPVVLLDRVLPENADRNALAAQALEGMKKSKPAAFVDADAASLIRIGNFEDNRDALKTCDWIIEAVAEDLDIKRGLLAQIAGFLRADAIITTNTSGLPVALIAEKMPEEFRRRWFGTHFFNPPRYMRLLEVIATAAADPDAISAVTEFADVHLGKTVIPAHDTRNFIANRIGTFALLNTFRVMQEMKLNIPEIDALTGSAIGWPKTGTFRLADLVGIDVLASVAKNFSAHVSDERADVQPPTMLSTLVERKWLGDKTGQGFYKKQRGADGKEVRLALDLETLEYAPAARANFAELELAKNQDSAAQRIRALLGGDPKSKASQFYRRILPELWAYAANRIGEVADTLVDIDRAMRAGFNWELGPFEMWDAAGVAATVEKMRAAGQPIPAAVEKLLGAGGDSWYRNEGREYFDPASGRYKPVPEISGQRSVAQFARAHGVVAQNAGASLVDMGDGIGCIEFHSKMNTIGSDIVRFILDTLRPGGEMMRKFDGFVISNDAVNFSVGANLMQVLLTIQDEEWDDLTLAIREFQTMTQAIKYCAKPVVAAPFGMCLGGGTEISLHATERRPHVELYMGLVEVAVGLVPAGGGCKEMLLRALDSANALRPDGRSDSLEVNQTVRTTFETIAMAKTSTSAMEARKLGLLRANDEIVMNRDRVATQAKLAARALADGGHTAPVPRTEISAPGTAMLANLKLGVHMMLEAGYISEHDAKIGNHVARILCGGEVTSGTKISEQYLLDLEREAFLSLCGERKTMERIAATLKTGKPLRN